MTDPMQPAAPRLWDGRELARLLPLSPLGEDRYASAWSDGNFNDRIYGGQLLGQALWAAAQTVPGDRRAHALQALFLRGAEVAQPMSFEVQRLLDGSRYSGRQVRVRQGNRTVLDAQVSFQVASDAGPRHQADADAVPGPEGLPDIVELVRAAPSYVDVGLMPLINKPCVEMRPVAPEDYLFTVNPRPRVRYWLKLREPLPDVPQLHDAALAYLSDYFATFCCYCTSVPMSGVRQFYVASLNHGLWIHEGFQADDWVLFDTESPASGHGRGLANVRVYNRARRLVASISQQCTLTRRR